MQDRDAHARSIEDLVINFQTHLERGLAQPEALARLAKYGSNELSARPRPGILALLWTSSTIIW